MFVISRRRIERWSDEPAGRVPASPGRGSAETYGRRSCYRNRSERLPFAGFGKPNLASIDLVTTGNYHQTMKSFGGKQLKSMAAIY
jgi:hypothetical protein